VSSSPVARGLRFSPASAIKKNAKKTPKKGRGKKKCLAKVKVKEGSGLFLFWFLARGDEKKNKKSDVPTYLLFFKKPQKTRPIFYRVFELPSPRNAQKRDKNKTEKKSVLAVLDFWPNFLLKLFDAIFFVKRFL
jgi:hypothetical protein